MDSSGTVIESQLDWLTAAWHTADGTARTRDYVQMLAAREQAKGNKIKPWRLMGYEGWSCARVRWGERQNAGLVQLSGDLAEQQFDTLYESWDNVSRVDLAVTVRLPERDHTLAAQSYAEALAKRETDKRLAVPTLIQNGDGGATLYVGDRTSDSYFRLYNKEAESKQAHDDANAIRYAACWRYELECKGESASAVALVVGASPNRAGWVQNYVHEYARCHGLSPRFPSVGHTMLLPGLTRRSDDDRSLAWLAKSVSPAVARLVGHGRREEVLAALGLA